MKVYNRHHGDVPTTAVYIGRPSKWGNPYSHMPGTLAKYQVATRDEAVAKYREYLNANPELMKAAKRDLKGKDLCCFCAPLSCHGDILLKVANE